eukprot:s1232_g2.t1
MLSPLRRDGQALGDGLKSSGSLTILNLYQNSIGAAGVEALADGLKSNGSLKYLWLWGNSIGAAGAEALAAGIIANQSLTRLNLDESLRDTPGGQAPAGGQCRPRKGDAPGAEPIVAFGHRQNKMSLKLGCILPILASDEKKANL